MADLDAELLALAGDTSDEEAGQSTQKEATPPRPTLAAEPSTARAATPKKPTKARPKRSAKRGDSENDDGLYVHLNTKTPHPAD